MRYTTTCATLCHFWCFVFNLSSSCDIGEPGMGFAPLSFLGSYLIAMLLVSVYLILLFPLIVLSFYPSVFFILLCVALPLPSSSCLGCIPPLIGSPSLRFMQLPLVYFYCLCVFVSIFYFIATMSFAGYFLVRSLLSAFPAYLRFPV